MKLVVSTSCVLLMSLVLAAMMPSGDAKVEKGKLIALENAWNQAQLNHDAKALRELVADSFVYTDYDGTVLNKQQFLADIRDPSYKPTLVANEDERVFPYANAAVVIGTYHTKGTYKGKPFEHYGRFTDTWLNQDGKWQCVASHTNLIEKK
jgi:ketosteroid isomerase-like protein